MSPTRREFIVTAAAAAAGAALIRPSRLAALQRAQQAAQQAPQAVFTPMRRNVGFFTMRGGTIGYLVNAGGVVVVDSQFPDQAKVLLDGINQRSNNRPVDFLINTHHHGDHSAGNIAFKGVAKKVVAHAKAAEHMHNPPGQQAPTAEQLFPDTTFTTTWSADVGDEKVSAKFYSRAHTSGDVAITFERANIVHMGDLMFNQRHPVVDRAAGATLKGWMGAVGAATKDHNADTQYIFGHAGNNLPVIGSAADLTKFRDYLGAVLEFVGAQVKAGHSKEEVLAMKDPLKGFEGFGKFGNSGPLEIMTCAYEEVTTGA